MFYKNVKPLSLYIRPTGTNLEQIGTNYEQTATNLKLISVNFEPVLYNLKCIVIFSYEKSYKVPYCESNQK